MATGLTYAGNEPAHRRLAVLDGWRAISIAMVLAGHMLPLGPKSWEINGSLAANGMAIIFTLSGFLIVSILQRDADVVSFLIRRFARILPLAWLALLIAFMVKNVATKLWLANFFFYANLPPFFLVDWTSHYWSLDLEMQFYCAIAATVAVLGRRGSLVIPAAALAVTALRIATDTQISIVSWLRVDEILAGGTLALVIHGNLGDRAVRTLAKLRFSLVLLLFLLSTRQEFGPLAYARPYLTAMMVGLTILRPVWLSPLLLSRPAAYLAKISYAVYIFHHFTMFGWLGSGTGLVKYSKRPLAFLITFAVAHASTFYFEKPFNDWSHRVALTRRRRQSSRPEESSDPI